MIRTKVKSEQGTVNRIGHLLGGGLGLMLGLTLLVLVLRVAYVVLWHPYGLAPDEAQYWSWLAHNDWSFLTKPPLTTWLMGVSTAVFGQTLLGVKAFALLGQAMVSVLGFVIVREIAGARGGWWAWVLLTTAPLIAGGGLLMAPDAVLLPLWLGAMLAVVKAFRRDDARALCWPRWLIIGVLIGLGGLAKYTAALFFPLLGAFLLVFKRHWLLRPQVWVSGLVALAFQLPVLIWNMQNDWVGIGHLLWQVDGGGDARHGGLASFGEFVGGQALVLGPVVFVLGVFGLYRVMSGYVGLYRHDKVRVNAELGLLWVWWVAVAVLGAFAGLSFFSKVQANWPLLGSVAALLVLAVWLGHWKKRWVMGVAVAGVVLNSVLSLMLMDTYKARDMGLLPLKAKNDPTKDLRGWADMGNLMGVLLTKLDRPIVLSSRYQTLAPLMFHIPQGVAEYAYVNAEGRRLNQYDLWPLPDFSDRVVVYVNEQGHVPEKVSGMFGQCAPWHTLAVEEYEVVTRRMSLWVCWGARVVADAQ